jgi:hypothetical protein
MKWVASLSLIVSLSVVPGLLEHVIWSFDALAEPPSETRETDTKIATMENSVGQLSLGTKRWEPGRYLTLGQNRHRDFWIV